MIISVFNERIDLTLRSFKEISGRRGFARLKRGGRGISNNDDRDKNY